MLESIQELVKICREHLQRHWYWWFTQICLWGHGNEPQSHWDKVNNNRKGALTKSRESSRVTRWHSWSQYLFVHMDFQNMRQPQPIFSTRNICGTCLNLGRITVWKSGCLCVKALVWMANISWWFLSLNLQKKLEFSCSRHGKKISIFLHSKP